MNNNNNKMKIETPTSIIQTQTQEPSSLTTIINEKRRNLFNILSIDDNSIIQSARRARRYKPVDTNKELIVLMPDDDASVLLGVPSNETDDLKRCLEEVIEYEEDSDGEVHPIAHVSLPATTGTLEGGEVDTLTQRGVIKEVHTPRVLLSNNDNDTSFTSPDRPTSLPSDPLHHHPSRPSPSTGTGTPQSSSGYKLSLRSSTTGNQGAITDRTTESALSAVTVPRDYKQYYAYDADPDDELYTDLMRGCSLPPMSLSLPALEEMIAALEHQLEWAYYTLEYTTQGQNSYLSYQSNIEGAAALIAGYDEYLAGTALPRNRRDPPLQRLKLTLTNLASSSSNGSSSSSSGRAGASVAREAYQDLFVREPAMGNPYLLPVGTSRHRSSSSHSARARKSAQSSSAPAARGGSGGSGGEGVEKQLFADEGEDEEAMTTSSTAGSGNVLPHAPGHSGDMHVLERSNRIRQLLPFERVSALLADLALQHAEADGSGLKSVLSAGNIQLLVDKLTTRGLLPADLEHALTPSSSSSSSSSSNLDVCHAVYQYWALKRAGRSTSLLRAFHRFAMRNWAVPTPLYPSILPSHIQAPDPDTDLNAPKLYPPAFQQFIRDREVLSEVLSGLDQARTIGKRVVLATV